MRKDDRFSRKRPGNQRQVWNPPQLKRFRAGEAEAGANPIMPEGPINFGS